MTDGPIIRFTDPADGWHFQPGRRVGVVSPWRRLDAVVASVDADAGTVTLRDPTRWERIRWRLATPVRLVQSLWWRARLWWWLR
jgi:hypothetical protein